MTTTTTTTTTVTTSGETEITTVVAVTVGATTTTTTTTTTYYDFTPTSTSVFEFRPTFDGSVYTVDIPWSLFGQRYYVKVLDQSNTLIYLLPLIGSPSGYDISINGGYFTTTLVYRIQNKQFEVTSVSTSTVTS